MPPIPIYTKSPISAAAAVTAVTPKTEDAAGHHVSQPAPAPAPATTTAAGYAPPPAQPGAVPHLPQPTGATAYQNGYGQPYGNAPAPTPTTAYRAADDGPPPPQPGAVPQPPTASAPYQTAGAGHQYWLDGAAAAAAPASAAAPPTTAMPPQMAMAPVSDNQYLVHSRGTAPATQAYGFQPQQPSYAYSYQQHGPEVAQPGCHPPGYAQNGYAVNASEPERGSSQRTVLYDDGGEEGFWGATKKLAAAAGSKFSAAESEVWRRINGGKD